MTASVTARAGAKDTAQEFISTAVFGTSMSAHHILGLK
ncbi:Hypothetical protein ABZS17I87_03265 [Kosakonia cowanii]